MFENFTKRIMDICEDVSEEILIVTDGKRVIASVLNEYLADHLKRKAEKAEPDTKWFICKGIASAVNLAWRCGYGTIFKEMLTQANKHSGEEASKDELALEAESGESNGEAEELRASDIQQEGKSS